MTSEIEAKPVQSSALERHIQTIITSVALVLLVWAGSSLVDMRVQLANIAGQLIANDRVNIARDAEAADIRTRVRELELENARAAFGRQTK